jgi:transposase
MAKEGSLGNTREQLATVARSYPGPTAVMEAGMHSPWVSRFLQELGLRVIVANPRKTRAIYQNERKSDRRDAMMLARLARMDLTLLHPVKHGSQGYAPTQVARQSGACPSGLDQLQCALP